MNKFRDSICFPWHVILTSKRVNEFSDRNFLLECYNPFWHRHVVFFAGERVGQYHWHYQLDFT